MGGKKGICHRLGGRSGSAHGGATGKGRKRLVENLLSDRQADADDRGPIPDADAVAVERIVITRAGATGVESSIDK